MTYAGTVLAALAASACCWIPALLGTAAAGSLGISAALAPWRPYLLGLTGLFLAGGFWMVYRQPKADCHPGSCASPRAIGRRRVNIGVMWTIAVFALVLSAYPNLIAASVDPATPAPLIASKSDLTLAFDVKGMDCEGCAAPIKFEVERLPGVKLASIDFGKSRLSVVEGNTGPDSEAIIAAVKKAGFTASPPGDKKQ
jgi:copper chaperone CopZ